MKNRLISQPKNAEFAFTGLYTNESASICMSDQLARHSKVAYHKGKLYQFKIISFKLIQEV